jgi:hypothetical protein
MQKTTEAAERLDLARSVLSGQQNVLSRCHYLHNRLAGAELEHCSCDIITAIRILDTDLNAHNEVLTAMVQATARIYQMVII